MKPHRAKPHKQAKRPTRRAQRRELLEQAERSARRAPAFPRREDEGRYRP